VASPESEIPESEDESFWDKLIDPEDGHLDIGWLITTGHGFLPIALPITEPAVGVGLAGGLVYFHPQDEDQKEAGVPPSLSFAGGAATDNGTWAAFGGHMGIWNEGRTRYLGVLVLADANLTFNGVGKQSGEDSVDWNAEVAATIQELKFQMAPDLFVGGRYQYGGVDNTFQGASLPPGVEPSAQSSNLAALGLTLSYDDRDSTFTASEGWFARTSARVFDQAVGSDFDYSRLDLSAYRWWDLDPVVFGARFEGAAAGGEAPFFGLPFLQMRGVPAFRYLGNYMLLGEVEPRWVISPRWSLVGFLAAGDAEVTASELFQEGAIVAGGAGIRYMLAREQKLAVGLDVARGPEDTAIYFILGSYWQGF